jgi:hypothetical protein
VLEVALRSNCHQDIIERTQQKVYQEQFDKVMNSEQFEERKRLKEQDEMIKVTVPFPGNQKAGKMKRIARKHRVALSFNNKSTIKQGLVKLKQKTEILKKKDCIYQIPLNCGKSYIGETSQLWKERKRQHKEAFQNWHIGKSAV